MTIQCGYSIHEDTEVLRRCHRKAWDIRRMNERLIDDASLEILFQV